MFTFTTRRSWVSFTFSYYTLWFPTSTRSHYIFKVFAFCTINRWIWGTYNRFTNGLFTSAANIFLIQIFTVVASGNLFCGARLFLAYCLCRTTALIRTRLDHIVTLVTRNCGKNWAYMWIAFGRLTATNICLHNHSVTQSWTDYRGWNCTRSINNFIDLKDKNEKR